MCHLAIRRDTIVKLLIQDIAGKRITEKCAHIIAEQICKDVCSIGKIGATDQINVAASPFKDRRDAGKMLRIGVDRVLDDLFVFTLAIKREYFGPSSGVLQLFGLLAEVVLSTSMPELEGKSIQTKEIDLGSLGDELSNTFRPKSNSIYEIREVLGLGSWDPVCAFSYKPRIGSSKSAFIKDAKQVLGAGFSIVEMDTRDASYSISDCIDIENELATDTKGSECGLFFPNLTYAGIEEISKYIEGCRNYPGFKIDGTLDSIGKIQQIRLRCVKKGLPKPIITCYPLINKAVVSFAGAGLFVEMLAMSGVDIIYPGNRPSIKFNGRELDSTPDVVSATKRYLKMIERGWPMPSIAGGIGPSNMQSYYELLSANTAFYLGNSVISHVEGISEGAKLCMEVVAKSIELRDKEIHEKSFPDSLILEMGSKYTNQCFSEYIAPASIERELNWIS